MNNESTIAAIATPTGTGGIGIIRISGPDALNIATSIFRLKKNKKKSDKTDIFKSHKIYYGDIVDPEKKIVVDEVLLVYMKTPNSYTTEDVIEIQAHSGPFVIKSILNIVINNGAELAQPGEFTKRAFLNGRIDLTQAEAVIDIINSRTESSLKIAVSQVQGSLKTKIEDIRNVLIDGMTKFEAVIDFPEDVGDIINYDAEIKVLKEKVLAPVKELIELYDNAHFLRDGVKLAIVGAPNVGKSSLMNRLINKDRSIVTKVPGTTRDVVEESLNLNGLPVVISDTAGIHDTEDPVEIIGIKKTNENIEGSDLILFMVSASTGIEESDFEILRKIENKPLIFVTNKIDIADMDKYLIPEKLESFPNIEISAKKGDGIEDLKKLIVNRSLNKVKNIDSSIIPNLRHKRGLEKTEDAVNNVISGMENDIPFELVTIDISEGIESLGDILGISAKIDILDNIFSNFCIGK